jgi:DNA-binding transcriptional LysR family regulator
MVNSRMSRDLNVDQIKKLWILDLVIRNGSLKKAALEAKVTPSAISQTITALEGSFGHPLLVREKGSVTATQESLAILDVVRPAFEAFERLRSMNDTPVPKLAWLKFGTYESIAIDLLPALTQRLREKLPQMRLNIRVSRTSNLLTMVRKGELCSALITEVDDLERFFVVDVAEDRLGLFVSRRHDIAQLSPAKAIERYGIGTLAASTDGLPRYFTKFMRHHEISKPSVVSDSFETLRAGAAAGTFVAVLPERVANRDGLLVELSSSAAGAKSRLGVHGITLVSQTNCDREESYFLAAESSRILKRSNSN